MNMIEALEERGLEKGWQKGSIAGEIRAYQKLLKQPALTQTEAQSKSVEELQNLLATLEAKIKYP